MVKDGKKKVLLVLTTSGTSQKVIDFAVEKAKEAKTTVVALYLLETGLARDIFDTFTDIGFIGDKPSARLSETLMKEYRQRGYEELGRVQIKAMEEAVPFEPLMEEGEFVSKVLDAIGSLDIGLAVVVKRRPRPIFKYLSKTLAEELKERAPCEVIVFEEK